MGDREEIRGSLGYRQPEAEIYRGADEDTSSLLMQPPVKVPPREYFPGSYIAHFFNPVAQVWDWRTAQRNGRIVDDE